MTVEYVLLLALFVLIMMWSFLNAPQKAFKFAGPQLGARIESQLQIGAGFKNEGGGRQVWKAPPK
jgi:hypothetical protein